MNPTILILAWVTFISTLLGGLLIFKFRKNLHYFFAFAAGSLIAVSFLDLLPESIELSKQVNFPIRYVMITVVCSFFLYSLLERFFATHELEHSHDDHGHVMGPIGAGSLVVHSFFWWCGYLSIISHKFCGWIVCCLCSNCSWFYRLNKHSHNYVEE